MDRRVLLIILSGVFISTGCQHVHLRQITLRQASTLTDLNYQQVLDNLAHIVANPNAMPNFAIATGGQAQVDTSGTASFERDWLAPAKIFHLEGQRNTSGLWTLEAVNDTDKLMRMQCAYQRAAGCGGTGLYCQTCDDLFEGFYGKEKAHCHMPSCGWFGVGCRKRDIPNDACYWGKYCDTYVWVCADSVSELTRLTGVILDFAQRSPPEPQQVRLKWGQLDPLKPTAQLDLLEVETTQDFGTAVNRRFAFTNPGTEAALVEPAAAPTLPSAPSRSRTIKDKGFAPGYLQQRSR